MPGCCCFTSGLPLVFLFLCPYGETGDCCASLKCTSPGMAGVGVQAQEERHLANAMLSRMLSIP